MNPDEITQLKSAVSERAKTSSFAEEYPDAPSWAVELYEQLQESERQLDELERRKKANAEIWKTPLAESIEETTRRVASLAVQAGIATEEEKTLAKSGATSDVEHDDQGGLTEAERLLIPKSERHRIQ